MLRDSRFWWGVVLGSIAGSWVLKRYVEPGAKRMMNGKG